MEEQLIHPETAKLAKERGFDILPKVYWCNYYTGEPANKWKLLPLEKLSISWMEFPAPTQSLLQKWLREVHKIQVYVHPYSFNDDHKMIGGLGYYEVVVDKAVTTWSGYTSYEEALEVGLQEALKLL